eukprot:18371-Heterococcus_DN1.PRE.2
MAALLHTPSPLQFDDMAPPPQQGPAGASPLSTVVVVLVPVVVTEYGASACTSGEGLAVSTLYSAVLAMNSSSDAVVNSSATALTVAAAAKLLLSECMHTGVCLYCTAACVSRRRHIPYSYSY